MPQDFVLISGKDSCRVKVINFPPLLCLLLLTKYTGLCSYQADGVTEMLYNAANRI